jgi:hypothetical protein
VSTNPDCAAGKHGSCAGDAWDDVADERVTCDCRCHVVAFITPTETVVRRVMLPQALIDTLPVEARQHFDPAPDIDGWRWSAPTVIAGKRYDWWQHVDGRMRLAPSLLEELEKA